MKINLLLIASMRSSLKRLPLVYLNPDLVEQLFCCSKVSKTFIMKTKKSEEDKKSFEINYFSFY